MPNILKNITSRNRRDRNNDATVTSLPNQSQPFYLTSSYFETPCPQQSTNPANSDPRSSQASNQQDFPIQEQYSDPKDVIREIEGQSIDEPEQEYMLPFGEANSVFGKAPVPLVDDGELCQKILEDATENQTGVFDAPEDNSPSVPGDVSPNLPSEVDTMYENYDGNVQYANIPWNAELNRADSHGSRRPLSMAAAPSKKPIQENARPKSVAIKTSSKLCHAHKNGASAEEGYYEAAWDIGEDDPTPTDASNHHSIPGFYANASSVNETDSQSATPTEMSETQNDYDEPSIALASENTGSLDSSQLPTDDIRPEDEYDTPWAMQGAPPSVPEFNRPRQRHKSGDFTPALRKESSSSLKDARRVSQAREVDLRPEEEYDLPWELRKQSQQPVTNNNKSNVASRQFHEPVTDTRPEDEYDQPWAVTGGAPPKSTMTSPRSAPVEDRLSEEHPNHLQHSHSHDTTRTRHRRSGEPVNANVPLEEQPWYHGQISRVAAELRLRYASECSYLVRRSESSRHDYSLSIKSTSNIMHMKIQYQKPDPNNPTDGGRYILGQFSKPYSSIPAMINYYSKHTLNIKGAENVTLLYPVKDDNANML